MDAPNARPGVPDRLTVSSRSFGGGPEMQHILPEHRYPMHMSDSMLAQPAAADLEHSRYTPRDMRQQIRRPRPPHVSRSRHRSSETPSKANISPLSRRMSRRCSALSTARATPSTRNCDRLSSPKVCQGHTKRGTRCTRPLDRVKSITWEADLRSNTSC